jgi:ribose transport system permease protein
VLNAAAILLVASSLGQDARAPLALALTLAIGVLAGLVNGVGVAFFNVPAVVMTLGMNGIMEGLTLGVNNGLTCRTCASYALSFVQMLAHQGALPFWLLVLIVVSFRLHQLRPPDLRHRQQSAGELLGRRQRQVGNGQPLYAEWVLRRPRRHRPGRLQRSGLAGHGGPLPLSVHCGRRRRGVHPGGYILGGRSNYVGVLAGSIVLVMLVSVLLAERMPDYGRSILYGAVILAILLLYGWEEAEA